MEVDGRKRVSPGGDDQPPSKKKKTEEPGILSPSLSLYFSS